MKNNWKSCLIAMAALIAVATIHAQSSGTYTVHNLTVGGTATGSFGGGSGTFQSVVTDFTPSRSTTSTTNDTLNIAAGRCKGADKSAASLQRTAGSGNGTYVVYCTDSQAIVIEYSTAAGLTTGSCSNCIKSVVTTPTIPEGMVPIASGTITSGVWDVPVKLLDWTLAGNRHTNGAGMDVECSGGVCVHAVDTAVVQTKTDTATTTGAVDYTGATSVKPFEHRTSDPTCSSTDGRVWYRTDTDVYKACANDAVVSLSGGSAPTMTSDVYWPFGVPGMNGATTTVGSNEQRVYTFTPWAGITVTKIVYQAQGTGYVRWGIYDFAGTTLLGTALCDNNSVGSGNGISCNFAASVALTAGTSYRLVGSADTSTGWYYASETAGAIAYAISGITVNGSKWSGIATNTSTGSGASLALSATLGTITAVVSTAKHSPPAVGLVP